MLRLTKIICTMLAASVAVTSFSFPSGALYYDHGESPELKLSAKSAILIEASSGTVLYAKSETQHRSIASTTKIMTALLTIEAGELDKEFTVDSEAIKTEGTSMGLKENDIVTRRALCYGMLLPSGNDAANAAAVSVCGSINRFSEKMNLKAKSLGMENTHFVTPSGLDADGQYSCAYDLALLTAAAIQNETFLEICGSAKAKVKFGNPAYERTLVNSNKMLTSYPDCIGVKTGFTDDAGRTLVCAAQRDGVTLISVTLSAPDDWSDHTAMLDYGFSKIRCREADYDVSELEVPVIGGEKDYVHIKPTEKTRLSLTDNSEKSVTVSILLPKFLYAGFTAGTVVGEIRYYLDGKLLGTSALATTQSCKEKEQQVSFFNAIFNFFKRLLPF